MTRSALRRDMLSPCPRGVERRRAARSGTRLAILLAGCAFLAAPQAALAIPDGPLDNPASSDVTPPKVYTLTPGGVNISDGSFAYSVTDLSMGSLTLERHHVPAPHLRYGADRLMGTNMSHNFDIYVAPNRKPSVPPPFPRPIRNQPIVHIGRSASGVYEQNLSNMAAIMAWNVDAYAGDLDWDSGHYVYTDSTGAIYAFNSTVPATGPLMVHSQRIAQIDFPDGRRQTFTYNTSKQLKLVSDTSGAAIVFDYDSGGRVSAACAFNLSQSYVSVNSTCDGAALRTAYTYNSAGAMASATDVDGKITTYPGNERWGIPCVMRQDESVCQVANLYADGQVVRQTMADGSIWNILSAEADVADPDLPAFDGDSHGSLTDPNGQLTSFAFTRTTPYTVTDPLGRVTRYRFSGAVLFDYMLPAYSDGTMLVEAELPEGNLYTAEYLGPFNSITRQTLTPKPGSSLAPLVQRYGYGGTTLQNAAKPTWILDASGNQTDYTYAAHGGLLTEMQAAPTTGAARPLKVVTYALRSAYVKNAAGSLVAAATAIWQPATETLCQTAAGSSTPVCDPAAPQTVTTFEYGANGTADNLLLRARVVSDGPTSRRTCYTYDARGNRISETEPRGTSPGTCP